MNSASLEALLAGLMRLWQVRARISTGHADNAISALVEADGHRTLTVTWREAPFGIVWQVQVAGGRVRSYPSVNGLIRDLRERLVLERGSARVLFVQGAER